MGNFTVNAIFAFVFAGFAWNSLRRGWRFFRVGWLAFKANEHRENTGQNYDLHQESQFLIAGLAWLSGGLISAALVIMFVGFAIFGIGIFDFIS